MAATFTTRSEQRTFGGTQGFYEAASAAVGGPMRFGVFVPPEAAPVTGVVYYLAGLECNETTAPQKSGIQRAAAELGLVVVTPDTSPRHARFPGDDESWDFGQSAGFYLDATAEPWRTAYQLETHIVEELPALLESHFGVPAGKRAIMGHSMGGHGALTLALRHPERYVSVSALAPIVAPSQVPWGQQAFTRFLGDEPSTWAEHDTTALVTARRRWQGTALVDQGMQDKFLARELRPELLEKACAEAGLPLALRRHEGYDHSYYFVASFVPDHLEHHARAM